MALGYTNCSTTDGVVNVSSSLTPDANNTSTLGVNSTCVNVWGTSGDDTVTFGTGALTHVSVGAIIDDQRFLDISYLVMDESARRGFIPVPRTFTGLITAADINVMKNDIDLAGYTAGFAGVSLGTPVAAANINGLIDKIEAAGNICVCNCNYCTCNCNYCTCNCNYSCTCNCNYSDERLKTEITFM